jgi:hypothetical protein
MNNIEDLDRRPDERPSDWLARIGDTAFDPQDDVPVATRHRAIEGFFCPQLEALRASVKQLEERCEYLASKLPE